MPLFYVDIESTAFSINTRWDKSDHDSAGSLGIKCRKYWETNQNVPRVLICMEERTQWSQMSRKITRLWGCVESWLCCRWIGKSNKKKKSDRYAIKKIPPQLRVIQTCPVICTRCRGMSNCTDTSYVISMCCQVTCRSQVPYMLP